MAQDSHDTVPEDITEVTDDTVVEEKREAKAVHGADRRATPDEEAAANRAEGITDDVRDAEKAAMERGVNVKGEGEI